MSYAKGPYRLRQRSFDACPLPVDGGERICPLAPPRCLNRLVVGLWLEQQAARLLCRPRAPWSRGARAAVGGAEAPLHHRPAGRLCLCLCPAHTVPPFWARDALGCPISPEVSEVKAGLGLGLPLVVLID